MMGYLLIILLLAVIAFSMYVFKTAVVRVESPGAEAKLDDWEKRRKWPVDALRDGLRWYRGQKTETVYVSSFDGLRLAADYLPAAGPARGRMLLFHGYHGGIEDFAGTVRFFHDEGYDLLIPDQRAHGRSGGKFIGYGVLERRDCLTWAREADCRWGEVPTFLAGVSMGATTVLMAAGEELPPDVRGVIADCGFTSPREIIARTMGQMHLPPYPFVWLAGGWSRLLAGYGFGEYSTLTAMEKNRLPVLFFHGEEDKFVPPEMTIRNFAACRAEKELVTVPSAEHCQSFLLEPERCRRAASAFFKKHTSAAEAARV